MNLDLHYLKLLPVRPPPEVGEVFTGYLARLGAENGIRRGFALFQLVDLSREVLHRPSECPPLSWGQLPDKVLCSTEQLLSTTLHHLGTKFGRSPRVGSASRFLSGVLSPNVRYCPRCLEERPWYALSWRFLTLQACPVHACRLLERCGHCMREIMPLTSPLRVLKCPMCAEDLRRCSAAPVGDDIAQAAGVHARDLAYLLAPTSADLNGMLDPLKLGTYLAGRRQERGLRQADAAEVLDIRVGQIGAIERGDVHLGPLFRNYLDYAAYLDVTLEEAFVRSVQLDSAVAIATERYDHHDYQIGDQHHADDRDDRNHHEYEEQRLLSSARQAIENLRVQDKPVTQAAILQATGIKRWSLEKYPRVQAELGRVKDERARLEAARSKAVEDALLARVEEAISALRKLEILVSQTGVSKIVGVGRTRLNYYPRVRAVLRGACEGSDGIGPGRNGKHTGVPKGLSEGEVLLQVESALQSLHRRRRPVTIRAITKWVNMSVGQLRQYKSVEAALARAQGENLAVRYEHLTAHKHIRERALAERVKDAIELLRVEDRKPTQVSISELVGVSVPALLCYPRVRELLEGLEAEKREAHERLRLRKEDILVERVQESIAGLVESGVLVTQTALEEWLGLSISGLAKYPKIWAILRDLKKHVRRERARKAEYEKRMLVSRAVRAVTALEKSGESVTYRAIGDIVSRSTAALKRYPAIRVAVEKSPNNPRNSKCDNERNSTDA